LCLLSWYPAISSHWPDMATNHGHLAELGHSKYLVVAFLIRFGGILGSFGLTTGIFSPKYEPWFHRPNSPDVPPKRTKKLRLSIKLNTYVHYHVETGVNACIPHNLNRSWQSYVVSPISCVINAQGAQDLHFVICKRWNTPVPGLRILQLDTWHILWASSFKILPKRTGNPKENASTTDEKSE